MRAHWLLVVLVVLGARDVRAQGTSVGAAVGANVDLFAGEMLTDVSAHAERYLGWRSAIRGDAGLLERPGADGGRLAEFTVTGLYRRMDRRGRPYSGLGISLYRPLGNAGPEPAGLGLLWVTGSEIGFRERLSIPIELRFKAGAGLSVGLSVGIRRWR